MIFLFYVYFLLRGSKKEKRQQDARHVLGKTPFQMTSARQRARDISFVLILHLHPLVQKPGLEN